MNQPLHRFLQFEPHGIGFMVVLGDVTGVATEKLNDSVIAQVELPGALQTDYARKRDDAFYGRLMARQTKCELPTRGMANHQHASRVQAVVTRARRHDPLPVA